MPHARLRLRGRGAHNAESVRIPDGLRATVACASLLGAALHPVRLEVYMDHA